MISVWCSSVKHVKKEQFCIELDITVLVFLSIYLHEKFRKHIYNSSASDDDSQLNM